MTGTPSLSAGENENVTVKHIMLCGNGRLDTEVRGTTCQDFDQSCVFLKQKESGIYAPVFIGWRVVKMCLCY